jgi:hypothetical protein
MTNNNTFFFVRIISNLIVESIKQKKIVKIPIKSTVDDPPNSMEKPQRTHGKYGA